LSIRETSSNIWKRGVFRSMTDKPMRFEDALLAIEDKDVKNLVRLLAEDRNLVTMRDGAGRTLLHAVVGWPGGNPDGPALAQALLGAGADPNARLPNTGETVLHWAASNDGDSPVIEVLAKAGANLDAAGGVVDGGTPLDNAVHFGKMTAAETLSKCGASVYNLRIAAGLGRLQQMDAWLGESGRLLAEAGRPAPDFKAAFGTLSDERSQLIAQRAFCAAVFCLQFQAADWLLQFGVDINAIPEGSDSTLLHQVAYRGKLPMAMYLVARGADLNIPSPVYQGTPFQYGFVHGKPDIMNYLIDQGSEISLRTAAHCGRLDIVIKRWDECQDPETLLKETVGDKTAVGKPIHPETMNARAAVARFIRSRIP
jgi:ankyrin repeat protein